MGNLKIVVSNLLKTHGVLLSLGLLLGLIGLKDYSIPGLYTAHDIWHQVARLYWYSQALKDGQILPSYLLPMAQGFGYPLFIFSYHLPWIFGAPLVLIGVAIGDVIKLLFGISFLASGLIVYGLVFRITKRHLAAFISQLLSMWMPYHFLTLFVSASIGTAFIFVTFPMLLWGIYEWISGYKRLGILLFSLGLAMSVLSHLMTFMLLLPFVALWGLWWWVQTESARGRKFILTSAALMVGSLMLTGFYLLPLLGYYPVIKASTGGVGFESIYSRYFINFSQLIYSRWGYAPITSDARDGEISFQLGIAQWMGIGLLLLQVLARKGKRQGNSILLLTLIILSLSLMLPLSQPVWKIITKLVSVDFPFRLLLVTGVLATVATGMAIANLSSRFWRLLIAFALLVVAFYTNRNHIHINQSTQIEIKDYVQAEQTTNTYNEYLPGNASTSLLKLENAPPLLEPQYLPDKAAVPAGLRILRFSESASELAIVAEASSETALLVRQFAWPQLHMSLDGRTQPIIVGDHGLIQFNWPQGKHTLMLTVGMSPLMKVGWVVTLLGLVLLLGLLLAVQPNAGKTTEAASTKLEQQKRYYKI